MAKESGEPSGGDARSPCVAVIGAGPAGLFAAQQLISRGIRVVLLNRDIKPGGLAEYGIYYEKHRIKEMLRGQFRKILDAPGVRYFGNVTVAEDGDLTLRELRAMGFAAIVVAVGAQGTKSLGLPGEELEGVYHAKDVIYHYNLLPPFSQWEFLVGKRVALIGVGNVMADIAHWLVRDVQVDEVIAVARRGPAEVKFTRPEIEYIARNLDLPALDAEIERVAARMRAVGQDPEAAKAFIVSALSERALPRVSDSRMRFRFLSSPVQILGDERGRVRALEVEDTELVPQADGGVWCRSVGTRFRLDVDTVIFCIGDQVSPSFGLPVQRHAFVKHPNPRFPVEGMSYEAYDPETQSAIEGIFVAGWARWASTGQVGFTRKDAINCVQAVVQYLEQGSPPFDDSAIVEQRVEQRLAQLNKPVVTTEDWRRLEAVEMQEATRLGLEEFKFATNDEMLAAIRRPAPA